MCPDTVWSGLVWSGKEEKEKGGKGQAGFLLFGWSLRSFFFFSSRILFFSFLFFFSTIQLYRTFWGYDYDGIGYAHIPRLHVKNGREKSTIT